MLAFSIKLILFKWKINKWNKKKHKLASSNVEMYFILEIGNLFYIGKIPLKFFFSVLKKFRFIFVSDGKK